MKTLVIFDDVGIVYSQVSGEYLLPQGGIQFLETEVPEGKYVSGVDVSVTPHQVILEGIPKSETQLLKEELEATQLALAELAETLLGGA